MLGYQQQAPLRRVAALLARNQGLITKERYQEELDRLEKIQNEVEKKYQHGLELLDLVNKTFLKKTP